MEMNGEHRIAAPKAQVWAALNDPEILKGAIPGCEELIMASPTEMTAKVRAKVGPVSARFAGKVTISDIDAPNGYRITGEGSGGVAGFAKGGAKVALTEDGDATIMRYEVSAQVGGKLAQIGSRLIDGTAKQMANEFFTKFSAAAESYVPSGDAAPAPVIEAAPVAPVAPVAAAAPVADDIPAAPAREPVTSEVADDEIVAAPAPVSTFTPRPAPAAPATPPTPAAVDPLQAEAPDGAAVPAPQPAPAAAAPSRPAASSPMPAPTKPAAGMSPIVWVTGVIVVAGIILYFATR